MDNPCWEQPPTHLVIYAKHSVAKGGGGQSIVADSRAVLRQLREEAPELVAALEARRVRYQHFFLDRGRFPGKVITSWQQSLAAKCDDSQVRVPCNATELAERTMLDGGFGF